MTTSPIALRVVAGCLLNPDVTARLGEGVKCCGRGVAVFGVLSHCGDAVMQRML